MPYDFIFNRCQPQADKLMTPVTNRAMVSGSGTGDNGTEDDKVI